MTKTKRSIDILLVEDNPGDIRLIQEALREHQLSHQLYIVNDGDQALAFLHQKPPHQQAPRPDIILLDLDLPKMDGMQLLKSVKQHKILRSIPVVVLTNSDAEQDINDAYAHYANAYVLKSANLDRFVHTIEIITGFWLNTVQLPPD